MIYDILIQKNDFRNSRNRFYKAIHCLECKEIFTPSSPTEITCSNKCRFSLGFIPLGKLACWDWKMAIYPSTGYGVFSVITKDYKFNRHAHRISWIINNKIDVPEKLEICHTCDNRKCVNPFHLFLGTGSDNMIDMSKKDRGGKAKLSTEQVKEIKLSNERAYIIARRYGVSNSCINDIRHQRTWSYI